MLEQPPCNSPRQGDDHTAGGVGTHETRRVRMCATTAAAVLLLMPASLSFLIGCGPPDRAFSPHLTDILAAQADAWNRGEIEEYMEHYWKSDELTFSAGGQTTNGWQATLDRYKRRYPTPERMGRLTFDIERMHPLGKRAAFVLGRWHLTREPDSIGGNFSVIFQQIDGRWVIVHDHSSTEETDDS